MRINIKGVIIPDDEAWIYELFDIAHTSPKSVYKEIQKANGEDLEVIINSGGGSAYDASEIYTELKSYSGFVDVRIVGLAASAASLIAMSGDKVRISPAGQIMVHNAATIAWGDYRDMDGASDMLKSTNQSIVNAYRLKTQMEEKELFNLMDKETWMSPQVALENGFVDEVMFEETNTRLSASASVANMIPQAVIDGIRNGVLKNKQKQNGQETGDYVTKEMFNEAIENLKNELKQTNNEPPEPKPTPNNENKWGNLFLNL